MDNKKVKLGRVGRMNLKKLISKHPRRSEINSKKSLSHWKTCELIDFCVQLGIDFTQYISSRQTPTSGNTSTCSVNSTPNLVNSSTNIVPNVNTRINMKDDKTIAVKCDTHPFPCEIKVKEEKKMNDFCNPSILDAMSQFLVDQSDLLTLSFSLTINVNILIGNNSIDFLMDDQSTILEIKERICCLYEAPLPSLHLLHNNRFVKDDTKILNLASNLYLQLRLITSVSVHYNGVNGDDKVLKCFNSCCIFDIQKKICEIEEVSQCKLYFNDVDISNAEYEIGTIVNSNCYSSMSILLKVIYNDKSNLLENCSYDYYLHVNEEEDIFSPNDNNPYDEIYCYFNSDY